MLRSVEGLKIGGMYFLPVTYAKELIRKEFAQDVFQVAARAPVESAQPGPSETTVAAGPSRNKIVQPSQRKKSR
jgi:hypothetical protein